MRFLELFSGTKRLAQAFHERGWDTYTVDAEPGTSPDLVADILKVSPALILTDFGKPDVIWASPPCEGFSVMTIGRYWRDGMPKHDTSRKGLDMLKKTLWLIRHLEPTYYFIENPRAMMRTRPELTGYPRRTVTYCQYGEDRQKPTDIWTNCTPWVSRRPCRAGDPCHPPTPRSAKDGTQKIKGAHNRAALPLELCQEISAACSGSPQGGPLDIWFRPDAVDNGRGRP